MILLEPLKAFKLIDIVSFLELSISGTPPAFGHTVFCNVTAVLSFRKRLEKALKHDRILKWDTKNNKDFPFNNLPPKFSALFYPFKNSPVRR